MNMISPSDPKRLVLRAALAVACAGAIAWFSLMPAVDLPEVPLFGWDKLQHAASYAILTFLSGFALVVRSPGSMRGWWQGAAVAISFGILMEICQGIYTSDRIRDPEDILANSIGALAAVLVVYVVRACRAGAGKNPSP